MTVVDCLLVGHNEMNFADYYGILENMAASSGRDHVAFRDLQYNCVEYKGAHHQGQDLLTTLYNEGRSDAEKKIFYNGDCFWTALAYLGTYLNKRGYSFHYVNLFQFEKEKLREMILNNEYRAIVLTGTMYVFEQNIWEVVKFIRSIRKDIKIVAGGPYISKQAEEREPEYLKPLFKYLDADFFCYGREGEQTLTRLIDALRSGLPLEDIPNLAYRENRSFRINRKVFEHTPLEENIIDYSLFRDDYGKSGWANVRISDGCPYACGFCSFPEHGNERYVTLSLERIEQEFDAIKACGTITHIFFVDATFNVPKKKFKDIMRLMIRKEYGFKWHCFFRCDQADEEAITLMKEAGCIGVFLGLESASPVVLRNMDKTAHKEDFRRTMPIFKRLGIRQMISVQVGFPGETYDTFNETMEFLEEIKPDFTRIQIWFCDVTTPVWFKRNTFSLQGKGYGWRHYTMDAETAVALVEDAFMHLEGVTWIPDPGYNWVFCYMLEKTGMSIERQKAFLESFAAAAKERLVLPGRKAINSNLLDELRSLAKFDDGAPHGEPAAASAFSSAAFKRSEQFWISHFEEPSAAAPLGTGMRSDRSIESSVAERVVACPDALRGEGVSPSDRRAGIEAALLAGIARARDAGGIIALAPDEDVPFPVPVGCLANQEERPACLDQVRRELVAHRLFGFFVVMNQRRMRFWKRQTPKLRYALVVTENRHDAAHVNERFQTVPHVLVELEIAFTLKYLGETLCIGASYDPSVVTPDDVNAMLADIIDGLGRAAFDLPAARAEAIGRSPLYGEPLDLGARGR
jgi:anaerobic magnesium-protoporphyrin IX monomethyl ester cyclase